MPFSPTTLAPPAPVASPLTACLYRDLAHTPLLVRVRAYVQDAVT